MSISKYGSYGHPSGKIGKLVHYMLKGQPVTRLVSRRTKSTQKTGQLSGYGGDDGLFKTRKRPEERHQQKKYLTLNTRFDQGAASYLTHIELSGNAIVVTKAFRNLETEYRALKGKLDNLPGKPS